MGKLQAAWDMSGGGKKKDVATRKDADYDVMYSTGFITLDYLNGTVIHVDNKEDLCYDYKAVGVQDGTSNTFISRPGSGKSTLVTQIIGNILRMFPEADAYIDDIEGSLPEFRREYLIGLPHEEYVQRVHARKEDITTESVYANIKYIHKLKTENRKEFQYDTRLLDSSGTPIVKLIPTLYFIDSFAALLPDDVAMSEDIGGGMGPTQIAKTNTSLIKKISQLLRGANIILFTINHITDDPQAGGFMPKPVQVEGLKMGERLPGGKAAIYLANNMFRLDQKTALKPDEGFGILGSVVDVTICKSRTNASRRSVPLIFDKTAGKFDNNLSILHYLKSEGYVEGIGANCHLLDCEEKFSMKNFRQKLAENPNLQKEVAMTAAKAMQGMLSRTSDLVQEEDKKVADFDINAMIMGIA